MINILFNPWVWSSLLLALTVIKDSNPIYLSTFLFITLITLMVLLLSAMYKHRAWNAYLKLKITNKFYKDVSSKDFIKNLEPYLKYGFAILVISHGLVTAIAISSGWWGILILLLLVGFIYFIKVGAVVSSEEEGKRKSNVSR